MDPLQSNSAVTVTGLFGQTVGSRVLLVIPPADGYGSAGAPQADINGTDTLVFVVDILAAA
jgi:peptidylprolyl isomerase